MLAKYSNNINNINQILKKHNVISPSNTAPNKENYIINWINSICFPHCLLVNSLNDKSIQNGDVFIEILINFLISIKMTFSFQAKDLNKYEKIDLILNTFNEIDKKLYENNFQSKITLFLKESQNIYTNKKLLLNFFSFLKEFSENYNILTDNLHKTKESLFEIITDESTEIVKNEKNNDENVNESSLNITKEIKYDEDFVILKDQGQDVPTNINKKKSDENSIFFKSQSNSVISIENDVTETQINFNNKNKREMNDIIPILNISKIKNESPNSPLNIKEDNLLNYLAKPKINNNDINIIECSAKDNNRNSEKEYNNYQLKLQNSFRTQNRLYKKKLYNSIQNNNYIKTEANDKPKRKIYERNNFRKKISIKSFSVNKNTDKKGNINKYSCKIFKNNEKLINWLKSLGLLKLNEDYSIMLNKISSGVLLCKLIPVIRNNFKNNIDKNYIDFNEYPLNIYQINQNFSIFWNFIREIKELNKILGKYISKQNEIINKNEEIIHEILNIIFDYYLDFWKNYESNKKLYISEKNKTTNSQNHIALEFDSFFNSISRNRRNNVSKYFKTVKNNNINQQFNYCNTLKNFTLERKNKNKYIGKIKFDAPISICYNNTMPNYPLFNNNYDNSRNRKTNNGYNKSCDDKKNIRSIGCLSLFLKKDYSQKNTISVF